MPRYAVCNYIQYNHRHFTGNKLVSVCFGRPLYCKTAACSNTCPLQLCILAASSGNTEKSNLYINILCVCIYIYTHANSPCGLNYVTRLV